MTDRFQFEEKPHGAGGFGTVIKGRDNFLERDVAVKVLNKLATEFSVTEQERFRREARILAALSHPNIPAIYDVSFGKDQFLIIFEFVEGRTLKEIIEKDGPCSLSDVKTWFTQIASALEHAHQRGVIHRDVKPANIIVRPDGQSASLVDFGIALSGRDAKRITGSGFVIGTPGYMSPEQERDKDVDHRTDIYALGVTMYEALAGKRPVLGGYLDLAATNEAIPPEIDDLVLKCLEEEKDKRLNSLKTFVTELEGALKPSRPLSEVLAHGKLHELSAAIEAYSPRDFAKLPAGQRALILAKLADIVASGDERLGLASESLLRLLLTRAMYLPKEDYRAVVVPAVEWAFEREFNGSVGRNRIRLALEDAAGHAEDVAHGVLLEEFSNFLGRVNLQDQENWYLHSVRDVIDALLANPACTAGTDDLVKGRREIDRLQRSRPSGSWQVPGGR